MEKIILLPTEKYSLWSSVSLWFFCGLGMLFSATLIAGALWDWPTPSSYKGLLIGVPIFCFMVWLRWQFMGQSTVIIDERGLTQRQPVLSPHVTWAEVASFEVRESTRLVNGAGAQVRVHRRLIEITTKKNRRVTIVISTLSPTDQQAIQDYLAEAAKTGQTPAAVKAMFRK